MSRYRCYSCAVFILLADMSDTVANTTKVRAKRKSKDISVNNDAPMPAKKITTKSSLSVLVASREQPGHAVPVAKILLNNSKSAVSNVYSCDFFKHNVDMMVRYAYPWKSIIEEDLERQFGDANEIAGKIRSSVMLGTVADARVWHKYAFCTQCRILRFS